MASPHIASLRIKGVIECELCRDTGWQTAEHGVRRCECIERERTARLLADANIPERYRDATFKNFDCCGPRESLAVVRLWAQHFADSYPVDGERGSLFIGNCGTGKTHLAIAILKALIARGISGRFCDYSELLHQLRGTYTPEADGSEMETLRPLLDAPILILDDIGAMRPSAWAMDTVTLLLNTRYRRGLATLVTTNYPDENAGRGETLRDRIGERALSRLREMCRFVEMYGPDYRLNFGARAS